MKLAYVGDGPRDEQMVPVLVERWIGPHERAFEAWHSIPLHQGRGYGRKAKYVAIRASRDGADALVATVDQDGGAPRLPGLLTARDELRANGELLPIAVGEAIPHGEAWLVDDLEPLRSVLGLSPGAKAPPGKDPKAELDALIDEAGRPERRVEILGLVAAQVDVARCRRARKTGLEAFHQDVLDQLGALGSAPT